MTSGRFILLLCACVNLNIREGAFGVTKSVQQHQDGDNAFSMLAELSTTTLSPSGTKQEQSTLSRNYVPPHKETEMEAAYRKPKPFNNIFMGIYKNFKSTYLGNQTSLHYKKILQERLSNRNGTIFPNTTNLNIGEEEERNELNNTLGEKKLGMDDLVDIFNLKDLDSRRILEEPTAHTPYDTNVEKAKIKRKSKRKQKKQTRLQLKTSSKNSRKSKKYLYTIGPGVNMKLDMKRNIVNVKLNTDNMKEILQGRWLSDNSEKGRGKKYDMVTKVLPLFVIPFLIQSAIVPFLVTKLKLLLMKSILIGKLAIFLLIISALKNNHKAMQSYEVAPSYWAGEPSRRSEIASMAAYNGYRVEGKPASWIN